MLCNIQQSSCHGDYRTKLPKRGDLFIKNRIESVMYKLLSGRGHMLHEVLELGQILRFVFYTQISEYKVFQNSTKVYNRRKIKKFNKLENCKALLLAKSNHLQYFFLALAPWISKSSCSNAKALEESF